MKDDFIRLADLLGDVVGIDPIIAGLLSDWALIAGPAVAEMSRPTSLRDGVLTVVCDDTTAANEVRLRGEQIAHLAAVAAGVPISGVKAIVGRIPQG